MARGVGYLRVGPLGVVARQAHDHQVGDLVLPAEFLVFADEDVGAELVALEQGPVVDLAIDQRLEAGDVGIGGELEPVRPLDPVLPELEPVLRLGVVGRELVVAELAPDADRLLLLERGVPERTAVGDRHGAVAVIRVGPRVADVEVLEVIIRHALGGPGVAVGAVRPADVSVVEQGELAGELAVVGHDRLAQAAQLRVAVALRQVAEDLVVGAVLLDDVEDVLDPAVVDLQRRPAGVGLPPVVPRDELGLAGEVGREVDDGDRALEVVGVARLAEQRLAHRPVPLGVEHEGRLAVVRQVDRGGEIAGVAEPADLTRGEVDLGQGVVAAVGDVQGLAAQGQGVGHAAEHAQ